MAQIQHGARPHQGLCLGPVRERQRREGKAPAQWIMDAYWQRRRMARWTAEKSA